MVIQLSEVDYQWTIFHLKVLNAIDANATCIAVRVDTQQFKIQVIDNGNGIQKEDLTVIASR